MEKIKSLLSPGKQTDDEIMYGSGSTGTPDQTKQNTGITGEGSHFDHTGNAHLGDPNSTANEPVRAQPFMSEGNTSGSMAGTTGIRPESNIHQENYRGQEPYTSGQTGQDNYRGQETYTSGSSGYGSTNAGPHDSNLANKADPRVDSDRDGRSGLTGGSHNTQEDYSSHQGDRSNVASSHQSGSRQQMPGRYPTGESMKETIHNPYTTHELDPRIGGTTQQSSGRSEQYTSGNEQTSGQTGQYQTGSNTAGTHSYQGDYSGERQKGLNVARTEDYSQDDRTDHNYGRDAAIGGGGLTPTAATNRSNEYSGTTSSGNNNNYYGAPTGTAVSGSRRGSAVNMPPPQGAAASGLMTNHGSTNAGPHDSNLANKADPRVDSDRDGRFGVAGGAYGTRNAGPYDSNSANKADPSVDSGRDGRSSLSAQDNTQGQGGVGGTLSKVAAAVTGGAVGGAAAHHATRGDDYDNRDTSNISDPANTRQSGQQGYQDQQYSSTTQGGQHGYSRDQYSSGTQASQDYPYNPRDNQATTQQYPTEQKEHHTLRNTAIGAGAAGVGAHEYREHKDHEHKTQHGKYGNYAGNEGNVYSQNTTTGKHGADTTRDTHGRDRFYGKEAAIAGTGGVAYTETAGTGHAQHGTTHKPYTENEPVSGTHGRTGASGPASNTSGPHKSNLMNKLDPRVDENYSATATTGSRGISHNVGASDGYEKVEGHDRHGNRTAVAGAGMPLGNDDGTKRYSEHAHGLDDPAYAKTGTGYETGTHAGTHTGGVGSAHQKPIPLDGVELPRGNQYGQDVKDPRYGLPMSAAGISAAEAEALRAHDDDLMAKHAARDEKHHGTHKDTTRHGTTKEKKRHSSILGFLHRDKNKKYTKEEEAEFDRQEREHNARSGLTGAGATGSQRNPAGYETNKTLPPNPAQQAQTGTGYTQGQQMNLTDRTRQTGDTTSAPAFAGGMVDDRGNPISDRGQSTLGGEIPVDQTEYSRETTASGNNQNYYGAPGGTATGNTNSGAAGGAYPVPGDGRDYPVGTGVGDGIHAKVLQKEDGRNVLHKKAHVIHPGAAEGEVGNQRGVTGTDGNY